MIKLFRKEYCYTTYNEEDGSSIRETYNNCDRTFKIEHFNRNGKLHNEYGPAVTYYDEYNNIVEADFYINNELQKKRWNFI